MRNSIINWALFALLKIYTGTYKLGFWDFFTNSHYFFYLTVDGVIRTTIIKDSILTPGDSSKYISGNLPFLWQL